MYERFRACENDNLYFTSSVTIDIAGTTHAVYATRQAIARNDFCSSFWQTFISLWFNFDAGVDYLPVLSQMLRFLFRILMLFLNFGSTLIWLAYFWHIYDAVMVWVFAMAAIFNFNDKHFVTLRFIQK